MIGRTHFTILGLSKFGRLGVKLTKMAKFGFSSLIHYIKINQYLQSAGMQNFSKDLTTGLIKVAVLIFYLISKLHFTFVFILMNFHFLDVGMQIVIGVLNLIKQVMPHGSES